MCIVKIFFFLQLVLLKIFKLFLVQFRKLSYMCTVFIVVLIMCFKDAGIPAKESWSLSSKLVTLTNSGHYGNILYYSTWWPTINTIIPQKSLFKSQKEKKKSFGFSQENMIFPIQLIHFYFVLISSLLMTLIEIIIINTKTTNHMPGTSLGLHINSFKKPHNNLFIKSS